MRVLFLLLAFALPAAAAQDSVVVNPHIASVIFEDAHVRVLRIHYGPHEKLGMHSHPRKIAISVTKSHSRITRADGTVYEARNEAGKAAWGEPLRHSVENLSDEPADNVEIELKQATQPAVEVPVSHSQVAASGEEPVPVEQEPHRHTVYQNQYVRVLDVQVNPGEMTLLHTHSHENIGVQLNHATIQVQFLGAEWGAPSTVVPGKVNVSGQNGQVPYTHRIKNVGSTVFHVLDVEILQ